MKQHEIKENFNEKELKSPTSNDLLDLRKKSTEVNLKIY